MENITQGQWFRGPSADLGAPIEQSLRFINPSLTNLEATLGTPTDRDRWSWSCWVKRARIDLSTRTTLFAAAPGSGLDDNNRLDLGFEHTNELFFTSQNQTASTTAKYRDVSAWIHVVFTWDGTTLKGYVNGVRQMANTALSGDVGINGAVSHRIGRSAASAEWFFEGYIAEMNFLDGTLVGETTVDGEILIDEFGNYNGDGVWVPKAISFTSDQYGNNGFRLKFDSTADGGIGDDSAPTGGNHDGANDFTANNFDTAAISSSNIDNDVDFADTPTNNFTTLNPLLGGSASLTFEKAAMRAQYGAGGAHRANMTFAIPPDSGKWYWEVTLLVQKEGHLGVVSEDYDLENDTMQFGQTANGWAYFTGEAVRKNNNSETSSSHTVFAINDTVGFLLDTTAGTLTIEINGVAQTSGNGAQFTNIPTDKTIYPFYYLGGASGDANLQWNFGQHAFQHEPSGYKNLALNNLPEPAIKKGKKHFGVLTYTTPGSPSFPITIDGSGGNNGDGEVDFDAKPDMVWYKMTNAGSEGVIIDSLRGEGKYLQPRGNHAEITETNQAFATNGFTFTAQQEQYYRQNDIYLAYCWKAGGAPTATNTVAAGSQQTAGSVMVDGVACDGTTGGFTDGTIQVKKMSVNTTAGFSIVQYEGTGSAGSIPHGLGAVPKWAVFKRFDGAGDWDNYHVSIGNQATIKFNSTDGQTANGTAYYNNTSPTSTIFTIGAGGANNSSGEDMIAYIFADVEGYSKFGKYVGSGSGSNPNYNGPFIYTGFKPAWVMVKRTNANGDEWCIWNSHRDPDNFAFKAHRIGAITPESSGDTFAIDFLANGFKIRSSAAGINSSGSDYIYCAFAEHPFGGTNQPPVTAR